MSPNKLFQKSIRFGWASETMKCATERPKCRKTGVPKISRNRHENVLVLEKQWAHRCCHISFPKSCYDGRHAEVSGVSRCLHNHAIGNYWENQ